MSKQKFKKRDVQCSKCKKEVDPLLLVTLPGIREKETGAKIKICEVCVKEALKVMHDNIRQDQQDDRE